MITHQLKEQRKINAAVELKQTNQTLRQENKDLQQLLGRQQPQAVQEKPKPPSPVVRHPTQIVEGQ